MPVNMRDNQCIVPYVGLLNFSYDTPHNCSQATKNETKVDDLLKSQKILLHLGTVIIFGSAGIYLTWMLILLFFGH
jgi:hypothetical protein